MIIRAITRPGKDFIAKPRDEQKAIAESLLADEVDRVLSPAHLFCAAITPIKKAHFIVLTLLLLILVYYIFPYTGHESLSFITNFQWFLFSCWVLGLMYFLNEWANSRIYVVLLVVRQLRRKALLNEQLASRWIESIRATGFALDKMRKSSADHFTLLQRIGRAFGRESGKLEEDEVEWRMLRNTVSFELTSPLIGGHPAITVLISLAIIFLSAALYPLESVLFVARNIGVALLAILGAITIVRKRTAYIGKMRKILHAFFEEYRV